MKTRSWQSGERKRTIRCRYCGGEHRRRSKELRECRRTNGRISQEAGAPEPSAPKRPGSETTRYEQDPFKGDKRAHLIARRLREGMSARKVAKMIGVNLSVVRDVERRLG